MIFKEQIIALAKPLVSLLNQNVNVSSSAGLTSSKLFEILSSTVLCLQQLGCVLEDECIITQKIKQRNQYRKFHSSHYQECESRMARNEKKNIVCQILNSVSSMIFNLERWITTNYSFKESNRSDLGIKNVDKVSVSQRCQNCRSIIEAVKIKDVKEEVLLCSGLEYYLIQNEKKRKLIDNLEEQNFLDSSFWKCIDSQAYQRQKHRLYPKADAYLTHWLAQQKLKQNKYYEIKETIQQKFQQNFKIDDFMIENLIQTMLALFKKHMGKKGINEKIKKLVASLGFVHEQKIKKGAGGECMCICECGCHHLVKDQMIKNQYNQKIKQNTQTADLKKFNPSKTKGMQQKLNSNPQHIVNLGEIKQKERKRLKAKVREKVNANSMKIGEGQDKNELKQKSFVQQSMLDLDSNESNQIFKRQHTIKTEVSGKEKKTRDSNFQYFFAFDNTIKKGKGLQKERTQHIKTKGKERTEGNNYQYLSQKYLTLSPERKEFVQIGVQCNMEQQGKEQGIEKSTSTTNLKEDIKLHKKGQELQNLGENLTLQRKSLEVKNQEGHMDRKRKYRQFSKTTIHVKSTIKSEHSSRKQGLPILKENLKQNPRRENLSFDRNGKSTTKKKQERLYQDSIKYKNLFTETNDRKSGRGESFRQKLERSLQRLEKRKNKTFQNKDSISTAKRNQYIGNTQKLFSISDLELFGGLSQSFSFSKLGETQQIGQTNNQFETEIKQLMNHIKSLSLYRSSLYNTVMSFLFHPFQTISKNEVLKVSIGEVDLKRLFVKILKLHSKKCGQVDCLHMKEFKKKIIFETHI